MTDPGPAQRPEDGAASADASAPCADSGALVRGASQAPLRRRSAAGGLERSVDAGVLLQAASADEFLPSVRPWVRAAGLVLLGSFAGAVGLMAVWPYRVVVRAPGVVRPSGEIRVIHAPFAGRVRQVFVEPNQRVAAGALLARLDPADLQGRQQELSQSRQSLDLQAEALSTQADAARQSAELEVEKAEASLRFAQAEYRRFQLLAGTGSITAIQLEEKLQSYNIARSNLAKARQAVAEQQSRSTTERAQLARELAANRAQAGQVGRDLGSTELRVPVAGVVLALQLRNPQQVVAAGEELARIAPLDTALLVKVLVPSQEIGRVAVGQPADLRIAGCPYPDFGTLRARVASIAPDAMPQSPATAGPSAGAGPAAASLQLSGYEVTLRPGQSSLLRSGRRCALRPGMDLSADIVTSAETVLHFLLRKARIISGL